MISLTSTSSGCSTANAMARAIDVRRDGDAAVFVDELLPCRHRRWCAQAPISTTPGEIDRDAQSVFSCRRPSEIAQTAYFVAQ